MPIPVSVTKNTSLSSWDALDRSSSLESCDALRRSSDRDSWRKMEEFSMMKFAVGRGKGMKNGEFEERRKDRISNRGTEDRFHKQAENGLYRWEIRFLYPRI